MAPEATTEPIKSSLPDSLQELRVVPDKSLHCDEQTIKDLEAFQAAANYIAVAQIFLTWYCKHDPLAIRTF